MAETLLHGTLHVTIYEVNNIHGYGGGGGGNLLGKLMSNIEETIGFGKGTPKMYATIDLDGCIVGRTRLQENNPENPEWNESFHIYCAHLASNIIFTVKDHNLNGATLIGRAYIPVEDLLEGQELEDWYMIVDEEDEPIEPNSNIHVKLQYFSVTQDRNLGEIKSSEVPHTFFPERQGCRVSLYQDAHVPDDYIPQIALSNESDYEPHRCWEDMFDAITNAKHFIYITGWSVYTQISLTRDSGRPREGGNVILGELLKRKASEGVKVLMLLWDDRTAVDVLRYHGIMATNNRETRRYFKDSKVNCILCYRNPDDGGGFFQNLIFSVKFSHHQKLLVVDSKLPNGNSERRHVVSFVGGLDLCNGRYDTPDHSLFRTLDTTHKKDFYQPNFPGNSVTKGGPREPWHDIHARLEGKIAWDVLTNFEERWKKQGGKDTLLFNRELLISSSAVVFPDGEDLWNVQLFRSIDSGATSEFPETPEEAARSGLVRGKRSIIDRSIQDAYIHAIRRAKNFIYIENQYFLGSSFGWTSDEIKDEDVGALHLIPKELSLKIVSKIDAGEEFTVYVVVPMWPEGIQESTQQILECQRWTMQTMYMDIVTALRRNGIEGYDLRDYLTFFCLGNREVRKVGEYEPPKPPKEGSNYLKAQVARRFMIYVHSKMMIVDDEYIIVGSANINQRSMDGGRDSETAVGAYQPRHITTETKQSVGGSQVAAQQPRNFFVTPAGQVYGFRRALWYEHLGMLDPESLQHPGTLDTEIFKNPGSTACVQQVNRIADRNWDLFSSGNLEPESSLPGHLLRYPIEVSTAGIVTGLHEFFPDTEARILGTRSERIPWDVATCQVM